MKAVLALGAALALALTGAPAYAQGKSKSERKSTPPSGSSLPNRPVITPTTPGAVPMAWIDDATVLVPGGVSVSVSSLFWQGADLHEVDFPVTDLAVGIAPRVQLSASVPRVVGNGDVGGPVGGLGTTYVGGKIALLNVACPRIWSVDREIDDSLAQGSVSSIRD